MGNLKITMPFSIWYEKEYLNYIYLMNNYKFTLNTILIGKLYKKIDNLFQDIFKKTCTAITQIRRIIWLFENTFKKSSSESIELENEFIQVEILNFNELSKDNE